MSVLLILMDGQWLVHLGLSVLCLVHVCIYLMSVQYFLHVSLCQVPNPSSPVAGYDAHRQLLHELRQVTSTYQQQLLLLRQEYLPGGRRASEEAALAEAAKTRAR
jgi:hypothetical protein